MSNALEQLHAAVEAVAPIFGVDADRVISFHPEATAQQRTNAQAVADAFDMGEAATAARAIVALRAQTQAAFDNAREAAVVLARATTIELLEYVNLKLTAIADTLRTKGVITAGERNNFVNGLATAAQARTAIKNRIAAGEAD